MQITGWTLRRFRPLIATLSIVLAAVCLPMTLRAADASAEGELSQLGGDIYAGGAAPGGASLPEVRARLDAGLPVTFTYRYLFSRPRRLWFDRKVAERRITRSVRYDPLSALYRLETRQNDGEPRIEFVRDRAEAESFLEHFDAVNLGPAGMDRPTASGLSASLKVHFLSGTLLLIPWDLETGWREVAILPEAGS